jgi:hypothetical protein
LKDASGLPTPPSVRELNELAKARNLPQRMANTDPASKAKAEREQRQQGKKGDQQGKPGGQKGSHPIDKSADNALKNIRNFSKQGKNKSKGDKDAKSKWGAIEAKLREEVKAKPKLLEELKKARADEGKPCSLCPIIHRTSTDYNMASAEGHAGKSCKALTRTLVELGVGPPSPAKRVAFRRPESKEKRRKQK